MLQNKGLIFVAYRNFLLLFKKFLKDISLLKESPGYKDLFDMSLEKEVKNYKTAKKFLVMQKFLHEATENTKKPRRLLKQN